MVPEMGLDMGNCKTDHKFRAYYTKQQVYILSNQKMQATKINYNFYFYLVLIMKNYDY